MCVASSSPISSSKTCTFTNPLRSTAYYFKLFTKDTVGNYSLEASPTNAPFTIVPQHSGRVLSAEVETQNGATTTFSGGLGNQGGGPGDTGTTTTATTTVSTTTPSQGGGGGDSGFIYNGSNMASVFQKVFSYFLGQTVTGGAPTVNAEQQAPSSSPLSTCSIKVFGICIISNIPVLSK